MENLPKKVETEVVVKFLEDSFVSFEKRIDEKFDAQFSELKREMNQKFGEIKEIVSTSGALITNTHQEVKHFVEMHKLLDGKVADLERRLTHLEHVVKPHQA